MKSETVNIRYDHVVRNERADFSQVFRVRLPEWNVSHMFRARGYSTAEGANDWWLESWSGPAMQWNVFATRDNVEGVRNIMSFKIAKGRDEGYAAAKTNFKKFAEYAAKFVESLY